MPVRDSKRKLPSDFPEEDEVREEERDNTKRVYILRKQKLTGATKRRRKQEPDSDEELIDWGEREVELDLPSPGEDSEARDDDKLFGDLDSEEEPSSEEQSPLVHMTAEQMREEIAKDTTDDTMPDFLND